MGLNTNGAKARKKLYKGVRKIKDAVGSTMGPHGRNVLIANRTGSPMVTKDGVTVARHVNVENPTQMLAISMMRDIAISTVDEVGDGTTTSIVLGHQIFRLGLDVQKEHPILNIIDVRNGMLKCKDDIVEILKRDAIPVMTQKDIVDIAMISTNGDSEMSEMIGLARDTVGFRGTIGVKEGKDEKDSLVHIKGLVIAGGFAIPQLLSDPIHAYNSGEEGHILISENYLNHKDIVELWRLVGLEKHLTIVCPDLDKLDKMEILRASKSREFAKFKGLNIVRTTAYGEAGSDEFEDFAIYCGCEVYAEGMDLPMNELSLGSYKSVLTDKYNSIVTIHDTETEVILNRKAHLYHLMEDTNTDYNFNKYSNRLHNLTGGKIIYSVGGKTEAEMKERKDRVDDAVGATNAAIKGGTVLGGGNALLLAGEELRNKIGDIGSMTKGELIGYETLLKAIESPWETIIANVGVPHSDEMRPTQDGMGWDVRKWERVDLRDSGIVDPVSVTIAALTSAVTISSLLLTTESILL